MKVLVTGLFEMAALHAIRRFGQMGFEVHVAEGHRLAFSAFSKYVSKRIRVPNMRYHPKEYTKRIVEILETREYDYYFPSYEEIILMSRYRDRILAVTKSVIPSTEVLMRMHDKKQLEELAHEVGIDSPKTFYVLGRGSRVHGDGGSTGGHQDAQGFGGGGLPKNLRSRSFRGNLLRCCESQQTA